MANHLAASRLLAAARLLSMTVPRTPFVWLLVLGVALPLLVALQFSSTLAARSLLPARSMRHPVNMQGCPSRGYPYSVRGFSQLVARTPLFRPDAAAADVRTLSRQVADFTFAASEFVTEYVAKVGIINGQRPVDLKLDCGKLKFSSILSGSQRSQPATIVWASRFSFETHLLLFRLHTYKDLVDNFFISESSRLAFSGTPKPLVFERVKHHFLDYAENITHHAMDDTTWRQQFSWSNGTTSHATEHVWGNEEQHHHIIYEEVPKQFAHLSDSDLVVYGDMDEMADEDLLFHLKHCELKHDMAEPINSNTVMWHADYRYILRSLWTPSKDFNYSLRFPNVWTMGTIRKGDPQDPSKPLVLRDYWANGSYPSEPGGWHLTYTLFGPALYLKYIGVAEIGSARVSTLPHISNVHHHLAAQRNISVLLYDTESYRTRIPHPNCLKRRFPAYANVTLQVPWLVAQNKQAFAFWAPCEHAFYDVDPASAECT